MKSFCYLRDRFYGSGGSEATVTAQTKIGWTKFRELLNGQKLPLKMKNNNVVWK